MQYSAKFLLGANFCDFMDRPAFRKIKTVKNELSWMKIDDVIMSIQTSARVNEMVLYSLFAL